MNPLNTKRMKMPFTYERELFVFKDGGTIAIDWVD